MCQKVFTRNQSKFISLLLTPFKDSLIPSADGRDFVNAALKDDDLQTLLQLINGLSIAHRDTLIYMVRHWKSLGELSYVSGAF